MKEPSESTKIWSERYQIEKERREKRNELMDEYDRTVFYPAKEALYERCGKIGHNWSFSGLNPLNYPMFTCTVCSKFEIRKDE